MKTKTCIIAILLAVGLINSHAQDTWIQKADFGGIPRYAAAAFSIGSKGYIGTGDNGLSTFYKDFWEYDPTVNTWTQKADFGGGVRGWAGGFTIGSKGYIGVGVDGPTSQKKDLWEYDPTINTWTRKADFGGTDRGSVIAFSIGTNGYMGIGDDHGCCPVQFVKDVWEYDSTTNNWTQKADFGGGSRAYATGFSIGNKGYWGTGQDSDRIIFYKDFWEFDPIANTWSQKADFGGTGRALATGFVIGSKGYIGLGSDVNGTTDDFWEYDPATNTWTQKANFGGSARSYAVGFSLGGKGYIGTGANENGLLKDFWEYTPDNLPVVMLSATNLTFGVRLVNTRSAAHLVTLTNIGPTKLTISSIAASEDFLTKNNCGRSVPPGASCMIEVAFEPTVKGVRPGTVTITDDAGDSPQTISLTGTGTVVQVSPSRLDFGHQTVGTSSDPQTATITNTGSEVLHIFGLGIGGPNFGDFAQTATCGSTVPAGGSCTIDVTFTPTAEGDRHASLKIVDDGGGSPQAVPLRGTGVSK